MLSLNNRSVYENVLNSSRVRTTGFITYIPQEVISQGGNNIKTRQTNSLHHRNHHTPSHDTVKLSYLRGRQIRQVKAHVKTEVLIGVRSRKKIVLAVAVGEAYADELKLLWSILDRIEFKAQHLSETTRQEVRNRYRKVVKGSYEDER